MPNGESKNWIRFKIALEEFWQHYNTWPTSIHLYGFFIEELSEKLSESDYKKLQSKIKLISDDENPFLAFDESGNNSRYDSTPKVPAKNHPPNVLGWLEIEEPSYCD